MKRLLSLTAVICLLISYAAFASDIDLTSLSDDDLQDLKFKVDAEVDSRGIGKSDVLSEGLYTIGEDIKEGTYVFYCLDLPTHNDLTARLYWYASKEDYDNNESIDSTPMKLGNTLRLELTEGMVLKVEYQSVGIKEDTPSVFAP